jgi:hypothetical protein
MGKTENLQPAPGQNADSAPSRRTTMLRKVTLAIVAAASLSATALAPTAASAHSWGGGWGGGGWGGGYHHHWGHGFGIGFVGGGEGCYVSRPVMTPFGYRYRLVNVCY